MTVGSIAAWLILFTASGVSAQDDPGRLQFEAASVKLHTDASPSTGRSGIDETPGQILIENLSLRTVICAAYGVKDYQLVGPGWLSNEAVDITAKTPAGYRHDQLQPLLRNLLADRFKLTVHHDSRDMAGYSLVIAKAGPKLREATKPRGFFTGRPGLIDGARVSMAEFTAVLTRFLGRPVVDNTQLTSAYEVKVEWTPDQPASAPNADEKKESADPGMSLLTAVNDQLGLRLQPQKVPVDMVIVDHMEKAPIEN